MIKNNNVFYTLLFSGLVFLAISFSSCDKDDDNISSKQIGIYGFIDTLMHDYYLWNYQVSPYIKKENYQSPEDYFDALQYKAKDKWSFMISKAEYETMVNQGEKIGFGFNIMQEASFIKVGMIYNSSESYNQGIRRGNFVVSINGENITEDNFNYFYNGTAGDEIQIGIRTEISSITKNYTLTRTQIAQDPLLHKEVYNISGQNTAYFAYENFFQYTETGLENAFSEFSSNNVSDLIIDLRYNGGGQISLMSKIIGMILPPQFNNRISAKVIHNDRVGPYWDTIRKINIEPINLNLNRVFIITSKYSASASESLINELRPYIDVYTIGETTHGKPVGMYGFENSNTLLFPVTFKLLNANDQGEYFSGIEPDSYTYDPISHEFGDIDEPCLKEALFFIENGYFSNEVTSISPRNQQNIKYHYPKHHNIFIGNTINH